MSAPRPLMGPLLALLLVLSAGILSIVGRVRSADGPDYPALVSLRPWIARYTRRRCGPLLDPDDITAEVLLRAAASWRSFLPREGADPRVELRRWLSGIAQNTIKVQQRDALTRLRGERAFAFYMSDAGELGADPADEIEARSLLSVLRDSTAPENWRAVLLQEEGYTASESGAREGVPKSTIEWRLSEARRDFANVLAKLESEGER